LWIAKKKLVHCKIINFLGISVETLPSFYPISFPFLIYTEFLRLCDEIHGACNAIILEFGGRPVHCCHHGKDGQDDQAGSNVGPERLGNSPHLLSAALRNALRYAVIVIIKVAQVYFFTE